MPTTFVELTDPKEINETHSNNHASWAQGLDKDNYYKREALFHGMEVCGENHKYFALKNDGDIVASLEVVILPALLKEKTKEIKNVWSYQIISVFTPERHRGNGYATQLLQGAVKAIDEHSQNEYDFSCLWSDIGEYYSRFGYVMGDDHQIKIKVSPGEAQIPEEVEILNLKGGDAILDDLAQRDTQLMKGVLERETEQDGVPRACLTPSAATHKTGLLRSLFVGTCTVDSNKYSPLFDQQPYGFTYQDCFISWVYSWNPSKITITRLHVPLDKSPSASAVAVKLLMKAAVGFASRYDITSIELWSQDFPEQLTIEELTSAVSNTTYERRKTSEPMARFSEKLSTAQWLFAGKYACY